MFFLDLFEENCLSRVKESVLFINASGDSRSGDPGTRLKFSVTLAKTADIGEIFFFLILYNIFKVDQRKNI